MKKNGSWQRLLSIVMVLAMVLAMVPGMAIAADTVTLYLKPNSNWLQADARFAVYYWDDNGSAWADMTETGESGIYTADIPLGYQDVIFCRMNPQTEENNWNNKWNQSDNLTIPEGNNCYSVEDGTWSLHTPAETPETPATDYYLIGYINGADYGCESDWENLGSYKFENGTLTATFTQDSYVFVKTGDNAQWYLFETYCQSASGTLKIGGTEKMFVPGNTELTFTLVENADGSLTLSYAEKAAEPKTDYYLIGYINGADYGCESDWENLGSYKFENGTLTATFTQDSYVFVKTGDNAQWYLFETYCQSASGTLKIGGTEKMFVPGNKELTFTLVENADGSLTLSYAEKAAEPKTEYYLVGYLNNADYSGNEYHFVDGKLTVAFTADSYVAVKDGSGDWYLTETYCQDTTATLKKGNSEKMFVPGNTELTFALTENSDGTLSLSYTVPSTGTDIPEDWTAVTIHFLKPDDWGSSIRVYTWGGDDNGVWPGGSIAANSSHAGWYDYVAPQETPGAFNFIFNDGGNQTGDLATGDISGDTELWVVGNTVYTEAPDAWNGVYTYTLYVHAQIPQGWKDNLHAYIWDKSNANLTAGWPGTVMTAETVNPGWYTTSVSVTGDDSALNVIINDGADHQTQDLSTGTLKTTTHVWVTDGVLTTEAPDGWVDPDRKIYVPGTFPGPSWDAGSNQMTYDPTLGLYTYTFRDVPAATYEFKIAVNGSWSENYGKGGAANGSNIAVAVSKKMDVTVYYSDKTHNAVTSANYIFADITLSGTGIPAGTKLTDPGLTGYYSAAVDMKAGTYTDIVITCEGKQYTFGEIEVDNDKTVNFYMDPVTGLFYCDAAGEPILPGTVYFDSRNTIYKSVFGAIATNEDCVFSIDTGTDITSAVLVIGSESFPMTASEKQEGGLRWSCTASVATIGEYTYYFALSNGSSLALYGDDDGYYGEGTLSQLTDVTPYDLVVYKEGYETPDWMKNAVIYQIFPDRFFDADQTNNQAQTVARGSVNYEYVYDWYALPENPEQEAMVSEGVYKATGAWFGDGEWSNEIYGGDLKGITQKIGYLKALGVNVIYLNPVFSSISNHRYDACDYTQIDPILGTMGDFEELVAVAEANGMHIILDGVFNHVSDDSIYFDRYYKFLGTSEKIGAYPYWAYVYDYMAQENVTQAQAEEAAKTYFSENYGITDWSYTEWFQINNTPMTGAVDNVGLRAGKSVYSYDGWWGYDSMPVIYSTNGSEYQTGNWAEEIIYNPDGTSATQFWLSKGSDGWRLDVANEVSDETWIHFRSSVKAMGSDNVIIGEIWDDATHYLLGDMYDSVMNYMFRNAVTAFAKGTSAEDTTKAMEKLRERYPQEAFYAMMNLVGSHDTSRILSYLDGIDDDRNDKSLTAAFPTYETTSTVAKNRQYLVSFLQFTYAGAPTVYYGDEIGMVGSDDPDDRRAFTWGKGNQELVEWYANLAAIRQAYPALRTGTVEAFSSGKNLLGYVRRDSSDALIVVANNASSSQNIVLDLKELNIEAQSLVDLITGKHYDVSDGKVTVSVDSLRGVILTENEKTIVVNKAALAPAYDESYSIANRSETAPAGTYTTKDGQVVIGNSLSFQVDALVNTFTGVKVNGKTLSGEDYDLRTGTQITLKADFIKELGVSKDNTIEIIFQGGTAKAKFDVLEKDETPTTDPTETPSTEPTETPSTEPSQTPSTDATDDTQQTTGATNATTKPGTGSNSPTGDSSNVGIWIGVLSCSAVAILILLIFAIRNKKKEE